jgi:Bifunctional DNA primase/polymerase, N-terminal
MLLPSRLVSLRWCLGERTVFIAIRPRSKAPVRRNWQHITFEDTQTAEYQAQFQADLRKGCGIGVLFGPASGDLVGLDIDRDDEVARFLSLNPRFEETFRTKGNRGCTFWFRMIGPYPAKRLLCKNKVAEWRGGGGCQSVVRGIHPSTGQPYQILIMRFVITLRLEEIIWPQDWGMDIGQQRIELPCSSSTSPIVLPEPSRLEKRVLAYIATADPAVMREHGHDRALQVATVLVWGYALEPEAAWPYLRVYNEKCVPPWRPHEYEDLKRKLYEALKYPHPKPYGYLLQEGLTQRAADQFRAQARARLDAWADREAAIRASRRRRS